MLQAAQRNDVSRDWSGIRGALASAVYQEDRPARAGSRSVYCVRSARKFTRLLVWQVSRLGPRHARAGGAWVSRLCPSNRRPALSPAPWESCFGQSRLGMPKWRTTNAEAIKAGQARARGSGRPIGRPKRVFDRAQVIAMRDQGRPAIVASDLAKATGGCWDRATGLYRPRGCATALSAALPEAVGFDTGPGPVRRTRFLPHGTLGLRSVCAGVNSVHARLGRATRGSRKRARNT